MTKNPRRAERLCLTAHEASDQTRCNVRAPPHPVGRRIDQRPATSSKAAISGGVETFPFFFVLQRR